MKTKLIIIALLFTIVCSAQIPKDKQDHFAAGVLIGFSSTCITIEETKPAVSFAYAIGSAAVIGAGKEIIYDKWMGRGTPELADAVYTVAGGVAGYVVVKGFSWGCDKLAVRIHRNKKFKDERLVQKK